MTTSPAAVDPKLDTFTIVDWTSTSRQITTPYTLVFKLRDTDETISTAATKAVWQGILQATVKGDDLKKLGQDEMISSRRGAALVPRGRVRPLAAGGSALDQALTRRVIVSILNARRASRTALSSRRLAKITDSVWRLVR